MKDILIEKDCYHAVKVKKNKYFLDKTFEIYLLYFIKSWKYFLMIF